MKTLRIEQRVRDKIAVQMQNYQTFTNCINKNLTIIANECTIQLGKYLKNTLSEDAIKI